MLLVQMRQRFSVTAARSEEHTSELQSRSDLVCRLLLEKKKTHAPNALAGRRVEAGSASPDPRPALVLALLALSLYRSDPGALASHGGTGPEPELVVVAA